MQDYTNRPQDDEWVDKLDGPAMKAFNALYANKEAQEQLKAEVNKAVAQVARRIVKAMGHNLTPPEAGLLANALVENRWILDSWKMP
jgi:hypothetical protein